MRHLSACKRSERTEQTRASERQWRSAPAPLALVPACPRRRPVCHCRSRDDTRQVLRLERCSTLKTRGRRYVRWPLNGLFPSCDMCDLFKVRVSSPVKWGWGGGRGGFTKTPLWHENSMIWSNPSAVPMDAFSWTQACGEVQTCPLF